MADDATERREREQRQPAERALEELADGEPNIVKKALNELRQFGTDFPLSNALDPLRKLPKVTNALRGPVSKTPTGDPSEVPAVPAAPPNKRGRPSKFTPDRIEAARKLKAAGKSNNEVAKFLYQSTTSTPAQRRSIPTILKYPRVSKK